MVEPRSPHRAVWEVLPPVGAHGGPPGGAVAGGPERPERSRDAGRASPGQDAGGAEEAGPRSVQPEHG